MDLKIDTIKSQGDADKEYVLLKAINDCDLKGYMITDKTFEDGSESNRHRHAFIFPSKAVKAK